MASVADKLLQRPLYGKVRLRAVQVHQLIRLQCSTSLQSFYTLYN
jgi:hypothetical protein